MLILGSSVIQSDLDSNIQDKQLDSKVQNGTLSPMASPLTFKWHWAVAYHSRPKSTEYKIKILVFVAPSPIFNAINCERKVATIS